MDRLPDTLPTRRRDPRGPGNALRANGVLFSPLAFLSCPIGTYGTPSYQAAARWLTRRYPHARLLLPSGLWHGHAHWCQTYRDMLRPVTHHAVLVDSDGFIGAGCVEEYFYLHSRVYVQLALIPRGPPTQLEMWPSFDVQIINWSNFRKFARIINLETGEATRSRRT